MVLPALPDDIYVSIFQHLALAELLLLRRVCRRFQEITLLRGLWISLLHNEVWDRGIPTPRLQTDSIDDLSASQLEQHVRNSLRLHRNWTSAEPVATVQRHVTAADAHIPQTRVISVHFITIRERPCLLSFSITHQAEPRVINLECWDISSSPTDPPKCIAHRRVRWFGGGYAVNSDHSSLGLVAIRTPHVEILGVDLDATNIENGFVTLMTLIAEAKVILAFAGSTIAFKNLQNAAMLLDITRPLLEVRLGHPQPPLPGNEPESFEAIIQHDYAVFLRTRTLELYPLSRFRRGEEDLTSISPASVHEFQFRIDSCRMECHLTPHLKTDDDHPPIFPIHILIRYSSFFPWPVNLIHHYTLCPNRAYDSNGLGIGSEIVNANNLPYHIQPLLLHTISSPVRLFSISDMAIGRYGTALWIDTHTEDHFSQADRGQRLAAYKLQTLHSTDDAQESQDQNTDVVASMVFEFNDRDDWNRIAVDDKEGWIAVGTTDGRIVVNSYI